jgi:hypothetical protein
MMPIRGTSTPFSRCSTVCFFIASTFSAWLRCRFFWVKPSEAVSEIEPVIVNLLRKTSARVSPAALNHSPVYVTPSFGVKPATTSSASTQPGTIFGLTNDAAWMWCSRVSASASISLIL